jgi:1-acyl-sn-glycerol-3-phosphate acyltransferase
MQGVNPHPGPLPEYRARGLVGSVRGRLPWSASRLQLAATMGLLYRVGRGVFRFGQMVAVRAVVENRAALEREGGFVLAVTHLSHVECAIISLHLRREIRWVTRTEFYANRLAAWALRRLDAIPVNRFGVPVSTIREAARRVRGGEVVGIFPEGGVTRGAECAVRGGAIKRGCCSIAIHARRPIVPCVVLGTDKLNGVVPWLPLKRSRVWVAYGEAIEPPAKSTRATRAALAGEVSEAFVRLYRELCERYALADGVVA